MRLIILLILLSLTSGCTALMGIQQHTLAQSSEHEDCGALAGEPRAGGMFKLSGAGTSIRLQDEQQHVLVCSDTAGAQSTYSFGPLLPLVPMFGIGDDSQPEWAEFIVINYSTSAAVTLSATLPLQHCTSALSGNISRCTHYSDGPTVTLPPQSVSRLRHRFAPESRLSINSTPLLFRYEKGVYFVFAG